MISFSILNFEEKRTRQTHLIVIAMRMTTMWNEHHVSLMAAVSLLPHSWHAS